MITGIVYIACEYLLDDWVVLVLVCLCCLDLVLIDKVEKVGKIKVTPTKKQKLTGYPKRKIMKRT